MNTIQAAEFELRRVRDWWMLEALSPANHEDCRRLACLDMARAAAEGLRALAHTPTVAP